MLSDDTLDLLIDKKEIKLHDLPTFFKKDYKKRFMQSGALLMFELKIKDYCFIAHSLKDEFFGPAKNLHGTTYIIELIFSSQDLIEKI